MRVDLVDAVAADVGQGDRRQTRGDDQADGGRPPPAWCRDRVLADDQAFADGFVSWTRGPARPEARASSSACTSARLARYDGEHEGGRSGDAM